MLKLPVFQPGNFQEKVKRWVLKHWKNYQNFPVVLYSGEGGIRGSYPMVKIYSTPSCAYCFTLKEFLKEHNVEFEEIDVTKDKKALEEIIKKTGRLEAPIVEIDGEIVVGFDKEKIVKLLNIKE